MRTQCAWETARSVSSLFPAPSPLPPLLISYGFHVSMPPNKVEVSEKGDSRGGEQNLTILVLSWLWYTLPMGDVSWLAPSLMGAVGWVAQKYHHATKDLPTGDAWPPQPSASEFSVGLRLHTGQGRHEFCAPVAFVVLEVYLRRRVHFMNIKLGTDPGRGPCSGWAWKFMAPRSVHLWCWISVSSC